MFSFRQKIFLSYLALFCLFLAILSPFSSWMVRRILRETMEHRAKELIQTIEQAPNHESLLRTLQDLKPKFFFRISVISNEKKVLFDSHSVRNLGSRSSQDANEKREENTFIYLSKSFDFHGKPYTMRMGFPSDYVEELTRDFEIAFLIVAGTSLLLFSLLTWFIINSLTKPIQQVMKAILSYDEGTIPAMPLIETRGSTEADRLAQVINSLSQKIQKQIDKLTIERGERQLLLESLVEGVVAVEPDLTITYANPAAASLLEQDILVGHNIRDLQQEICTNLLITALAEGLPLHNTMERPPRYFELVAAPLTDRTGAILVIQDKTHLYKLQEMRKDFVANASHELKTPLTIIRGFAELLHDNPTLSRPQMEEMTTKIVTNCIRMSDLIKDLLLLSDVENLPESNLGPVDLKALVGKCILQLHSIYPDAEVTFLHPDQPVLFEADSSLIELAIINLLTNAAKYSNPPAEITVRLTPDIHLQVIDQGLGIPSQDLERIFERFYRVDKARSKQVGGSGLGLSIVENIVKKHGGTISVSSQMGVGSRFTLHFPRPSS